MKPKRSNPLFARIFGASLTSLIVLSGSASAVEVIKDNNGNALNLGTSWLDDGTLGDIVPDATHVAVWNSTVAAANNPALGADTTWLGLKVTNPGGIVTIGTGANRLTTETSGIDMSAATQDVVLAPSWFNFSTAQTWNVAPGRNLRLAKSATGAANSDVDGSASGIITVTGGGVVDANQGTSGGGGFVNFGGKLILESGTTLRGLGSNAFAWGTSTAADTLTLKGGTLAVGGILGTQGSWTWNQPITLGSTTTSILDNQNPSGTGRTLTLSGVITGSGNLEFRNTSAVNDTTFRFLLGGTNTYTGTTLVNGTSRTLELTGSLGTAAGAKSPFGSGDVTVNSATLRVQAGSTGNAMSVANNFKLSGSTFIADDAVVTYGGTFTLTGANTINVRWGGKNAILNGVVQDGTNAGILTVGGGASLFLNNVNTYTGGTTVTGGDVRVTGTQGLGTGTVTGDGGQIYFQPTTAGITSTVSSLRTRNDVHLNNDVLLNISSGFLGMRQTQGFWIKNSAGAVGRLTSSSGALNISSVDASWVTTSGNLGTADHQIQGIIVDPTGGPVLAVTKNGANQVQFTRANTYTGGTTINGGRINANNAGAFGSGAVIINTGGQAYLNTGAATYPNNFTLSGDGPVESITIDTVPTNVNLGALRFENNTVSGNVTIQPAGATILGYNASGTITGTLSGNGPLKINSAVAPGSGTITLAGDASGFTSLATVNKGQLTISSAFGGSVAVSSGATLVNNGTIAADHVHTTGTLQGTGTFSGNLTLNGTAAADVLNIVPGALHVNGDLTLSGTTTVRASGLFGTVPVITYDGTLTGDEFNLSLENAGAFRAGTGFDVSTPGEIQLIIVGNPITWTGASNTTWSTAVTDINWDNAGTPNYFYQSDDVTFGNTGAGTVNMAGILAPGSIKFTNTAGNDYTLTGGTTGMLTGLTGITKTGSGNLTLGGIDGQNYAGPISIGGGLVTMATRDAFGKTSGITITAGGGVDLNGQVPGSTATGGYSWSIAGDGPTGLGAITNTAVGDLNDSAGIKSLTLTDNAKIGGDGGRFDVGRHAATATFGTITGGNFTLTKVGSNTMSVRAPATGITYAVEAGLMYFEDFDTASGTNPITVSATASLGTWGLRTIPNNVSLAEGATLANVGGDTGTWTGTITTTGYALIQTDNNLVIDGALTGTGDLIRSGANILALQNTATGFSGKIVSNGGTLRIESNAALGTATGADVISLAGGTLQGGTIAGLASATIGSATQGITHTGSVVYDAGAGNTLNIAGAVDGAGNLTKANNSGALTFGQSVTLTGTLSSNGGSQTFSGNLTLGGNFEVGTDIVSTINSPSFTATSGMKFWTGTTNIAIGTGTVGDMEVGQATGQSHTIHHTAGALTVTNDLRIGHYPSETSTYNLSGGSINLPDTVTNPAAEDQANLFLGIDGTGVLNQSGGVINTSSLVLDGRGDTAGNDIYAMTGGRLNVGKWGIRSGNTGTTKLIELGGGILGASADWASSLNMTLTGTNGSVTVNTLDSVDGTSARTITLTGALSGTGGLNKQGAGTLVLNNATSSFSGTATVSAGTLFINSTATTAATLQTATGGTLRPGSPTAPGALNVGTLNLNGGTAVFRIGTVGDTITAPNFNVQSSTAVSVIPANALTAPSTFTLVEYDGAIAGLGKDGLPISFTNPHYDGNLQDDTTNTRLVVNITAADTVVWKGIPNGNWDVAGTENWVLGSNNATSTKFFDYDVVTLNDVGIGTPTLTLSGTIQPASLTVANTSQTYTLQGSGITGGTGLDKSGAGNLVLLNDNTYAGAVNISGGTVTVGNGGTIGTLGGSGNIAVNGATLEFNRSDAQTLSRVVTGTGSLIKNGTGTMAVPTRQEYTGGTLVTNGGILDLTGGGGASGTIRGSVTVNLGASLRLSTGDATGYGTDGTRLSEINLVGGNLDVNTTANQTLGSAVVNMTGGSMTGILNTNLDFFAGASALNSLASATTSTISGVTLDMRQTQGVVFTVAQGTTPSGIDLDIASVITNRGPLNGIPGTGGSYGDNPLTKAGPGTMRLTAVNNYTGNTNITGGTLDLSGTGVIYSAATKANANAIVINGGGVLVGDRWSWGADQSLGQLNYNSGYIAVDNGTIRNVAATSTYMGGDTNSRGIAVGAGGMTLENATAATTWTWVAGTDGVSTFADNATLTLNGAGDGGFGQVVSGTGVSIVKTGAGTWSLGGLNTYTGTTTVNGGKLAVNGTAIPNSGKLVIDGGKVEATGVEVVDTLFFGGVQQASGTWGATGSGADHIDDVHFSGASGKISVTSAPSGYGTWASTNAPSQTADEDYDNDGVSNGVEYVLGGLASTNDLDKLPDVSTAGGNLIFTFLRDQDSETADTTVFIEVGTSLVTWPSSYTVPNAPVANNPGVSVTDNLDGTDTVTLSIPQAPNATKFARLKVVID